MKSGARVKRWYPSAQRDAPMNYIPKETVKEQNKRLQAAQEREKQKAEDKKKERNFLNR